MEAPDRRETPTAFTLSEFSRFVAKAISCEPILMGAWVVAEISDLSISGGHCYMTLIEKDKSGVTVARMRATIWANTFAYIHKVFFEKTGKRIANGMKVRLYGAVNYHINYGLSFNVGAIDPNYTLGDLERLRREILMSLQREGIIDSNRSITISEPPMKIAVISSEKAAGYGDFINQLKHNSAGVEFQTMLFPAIMQGDKTARSVIQALDLVEQTRNIVNWDCVAIIRGGGATTDMNGFDDLQLARRVATFPIPVIVGIGHERDRCVLDEIACIRCKTPTAVAAWLADTAGMAWQRASELATRVATYASERLKGEHIRMQGLETMIPAFAEGQLKNARLRLHSISTLLPSAAREATSKAHIRIENVSTTLRLASHARIEREFPILHNFEATLKLAINSRMEKEKNYLINLEKLIDVLNPTYTLKRGYTITKLREKAISNINEVEPGNIIETITASGSISSTVFDKKSSITLDNEQQRPL